MIDGGNIRMMEQSRVVKNKRNEHLKIHKQIQIQEIIREVKKNNIEQDCREKEEFEK